MERPKSEELFVELEVKHEEEIVRILELHVRGFRSLKDVTWRPGPLNVIIGPNGSGKSNILRLLELISASAQARLGKFVQGAGGMDPLLWDGSSQDIDIRMEMSPLDEWRDSTGEALSYELILARLGGTSGYRIDHELLQKYHLVKPGEKSGPLKLLERAGQSARIFDQNQMALAAPQEDLPEAETLLSLAAGPFAHNRNVSQYQAQLAGWAVYHDLHVNADAQIRLPSVAKVAKRVEPDGQNLIAVLHTLYTGDREFKKEVNLAMRAAFGDEFEELVFPPAADQRIQLRVRWRSLRREQSAADLSDGTLRFLFLLAVLASPSAAPLIAIDEPETGLHPAMLPIIADYAVDAAQRSQVIITTHSPAMLDAFQDSIPVTTVSKWEHGQTVLNTVEGSVLDQWLKDYSLGKLFTSGELEQLAAESR